MTHKHTFKASERLKSRKLIARLFEEGQQQFFYPFKAIYILEDLEDNKALQFAISVPRKKLSRAVHRNLLKRRGREAYRLNKYKIQDKLSDSPYRIALMFIYIESRVLDYDTIEKSINRHIHALLDKIDAFSQPGGSKSPN